MGDNWDVDDALSAGQRLLPEPDVEMLRLFDLLDRMDPTEPSVG
jgi:hypothetical protein